MVLEKVVKAFTKTFYAVCDLMGDVDVKTGIDAVVMIVAMVVAVFDRGGSDWLGRAEN